MNWKVVVVEVGAILLVMGAIHLCVRTSDRRHSEFLERETEALRAKSAVPMHRPPNERDILALAEKDSSTFCHPSDESVGGCRLDAVLMDNQWIVFAWPYFGKADPQCCAPDSAHLFRYSRDGVFLREERGGP